MSWMSGSLDEALRILEAATKTCDALVIPFEHTRAWLELGLTKEAKRDTAGACAAYAVVIERWGKANPRSVTADEARARRRALACAP